MSTPSTEGRAGQTRAGQTRAGQTRAGQTRAGRIRAGRARRRKQRAGANAAGLLLGYALDTALGDPRRLHPVGGYRRLAAGLERRTYADDRTAGARHAGLAVGIPVAVAVAATLATRRRPLLRTALVAATTWTVLGGTSSRRAAVGVADALDAGDLEAARDRLPIAGRSTVDRSELARAAVRSVAEETSTAVVAPLVWGAVAGLPGLIGYRAVHTLADLADRSSVRYGRFGVAAARADDAVNLVPSRFTAALTVAAAPIVGGSPVRAGWAWFRDGSRQPGLNTGQCEAAMAGALRVDTIHSGRSWERRAFGNGRPPTAEDIRRAATVSRAVGLAALALCVGHVLGGGRRRARRHARRRHGAA
jgi:adenosylcobinamide-phosphate synthase